jgi:hypothetical protein
MRDCLWVSAWFPMVQFQAGGETYKWNLILYILKDVNVATYRSRC